MKRMMNIGATVSAVCVLSTMFATTAFAATQNPGSTVSAAYVANAPLKAGALGKLQQTSNVSNNPGAQSSHSIKVSNVSVNGSQIEVTGYVNGTEGKKTPFDLQGTLGKGNVSGVVFGTVTDKTKNFKVIRFEVDSTPTNDIWYSSSAGTAKVPYMALYLEQSGTRNMTFAEAPAVSLLGKQNLNKVQSNSSSYSLAPLASRLWIEGAFTPDSVTKTSKASNPGLISPMTTYSNPKSQSYYIASTYNYAGNKVTDTLNYQESWYELTGYGANETAEWKVTSYTWDEYNIYTGAYEQTLTNQMTGWEIGGGGNSTTKNVGIKLYLNPYNYGPTPALGMNYITGGATWTKPYSGPSLSLGVGYSVPYTPLSVNLTLPKNGGTFTSSGTHIDQNLVDTGMGRTADWYLDGSSNQFLRQPGDNVTITSQISPISSSNPVTSANIQATVGFVYEIYNQFEPSTSGSGTGVDHGTYVDNHSWVFNQANH